MGNNLYLLQDIQHRHTHSKALLEYTHFGYMWTAVRTRKIVASHTVYALLEMEPFQEFLTEEKWRQFVHPKDLYKLLQAEQQLDTEGQPCSVEYRLITKTGKHIYVNHYMQLIENNHETKILSILDDITEQKHGEVVLEVMNEGFFELDRNFHLKRINAKTEMLWQVQRKDVLGRSIWDVFPHMQDTAFQRFITQAVKGMKNLVDDVEGPIANHWLHLSASPYTNGTIVIFYDLENEKKATKQIDEQAHFIESITHASADILYTLNLYTKNVSYTNRAFDRVLGYLPDQLPEQENYFWHLMVEEDIPLMMSHLEGMKNAMDGEVREIEYRMKHADGSIRWYRDRNTIIRREGDMAVEKLGIAQDITERKKLWETIAKNHNILQQSEELAETGSWEYNMHSKEFTWSDGMYKLFGLEKGKPVRPSIYIDYAVKTDLPIAKKVVKAIEQEPEPFEEKMSINVNGQLKVITIKSTPFNDREGNVQRVLGVDMDISTAIRNSKKIEELNKELMAKNSELVALNSELQTLTNIAANDYRETLKQLYTSLEYIISKDARQLSDASKGHLRRGQSAIQKMKLLTDDVVDFSNIRMGTQSVTMVNLDQLVPTVWQSLLQKKEMALAIEIVELPLVEGSQQLLQLLFMHLLDNAIKFNAEGMPPIQVGYKKVMTTPPTMPHTAPMLYHRIWIKDQGIGFPEEEKENIFQMFYRLHEKGRYRGSGVGLAICKKIMGMHNGFMEAASELGKGSVFSCYFPVREENVPPHP
jgi:PAS domain S-box-containing protein